MSSINLPPIPLTFLAALTGVVIASNLDANDQNSIGNFLENVGQTILTVAAQIQNLEPDDDSQQNTQNSQNEKEKQYLHEQIIQLKEQINLLEKRLNDQYM